MQQGGQKNPPWSRNNTVQGPQIIDQNTIGLLSQFQQSQQMYQSNLMQSQSNIAAYNLPSIVQQASVLNQPFQQTSVVAYPTPRGLNPSVYQNTLNQNQYDSGQKRVFRGKVTKLHHKYGFIDENVFFQMSVVKGPLPSIDDTVLVEATYNPLMPFKWNAKRIEVVAGNVRSDHGGYNNNPIPMDEDNDDFDKSRTFRGSGRIDERDRQRFRAETNLNRDVPKPWKNNLEDRRKDDRVKIGDAHRSVSPIRLRPNPSRPRSSSREPKHSRDRSRERSTEKLRGHRTKYVPRYSVQVPKVTLDISYVDVFTLQQRYENMYVPSDFFHSDVKWLEAFPPEATFSLQNKSCFFHVMRKDAESPFENNAVLDPPDASYSFSAKVMLLSMPSLDEIYRKCCGFPSKSNRTKSSKYVHPTRLIRFLVGLRGKHETMAIGGPWSPSLDGPNPDKDPTVLIKTAIRTCKALTGIDLANCTQWYRFTEIYYRRQAGGGVAADAAGGAVETVVIFVPSVWNCTPTRAEWKSLQAEYREPATPTPAAVDTQVIGRKHYSQLDPGSMVSAELVEQLTVRNVNSKGYKQRLIKRLQKCLDEEKQLEDTGVSSVAIDDNDNSSDDAVILIEEDNESDEGTAKTDMKKDKKQETMYTLPEQPHIIVHPSSTARSGKFNCAVISLSILLDYRPNDAKEHAFEVSLFAEVFNEMLIRDFGLNIYKSLISVPDKPKDDEKKKESGDKEKDCSIDDKNNKNKKENEKDNERTKTDKSDKSSKSGSIDKDDKRREERDKDRDKHKNEEIEMNYDPVEQSQCNSHLLLSYLYFDITHCWRIQERDAEQLLLMLGLKLSRAHVKKTIGKSLVSGIVNDGPAIYYRQSVIKSSSDANATGTGDIENVTDKSRIGNRKILPIFQNPVENEVLVNNGDGPASKRIKMNGDAIENKGLVRFKGGWIDLDNLMMQLTRSESSKAELESKIVDVKSANKKLTEKNTLANKSVNNLTVMNNVLKKRIKERETQLEGNINEIRLLKRNMKQIQELSSELPVEPTAEEKVTVSAEQLVKEKHDTRWSKDDELKDEDMVGEDAVSKKVEDGIPKTHEDAAKKEEDTAPTKDECGVPIKEKDSPEK